MSWKLKWWDFRYKHQARLEYWWGFNILGSLSMMKLALDLLRGKRMIIDDDHPISKGGFQFYRITFSEKPVKFAKKTKPLKRK